MALSNLLNTICHEPFTEHILHDGANLSVGQCKLLNIVQLKPILRGTLLSDRFSVFPVVRCRIPISIDEDLLEPNM